jgi:hypothetical protein
LLAGLRIEVGSDRSKLFFEEYSNIHDPDDLRVLYGR